MRACAGQCVGVSPPAALLTQGLRIPAVLPVVWSVLGHASGGAVTVVGLQTGNMLQASEGDSESTRQQRQRHSVNERVIYKEWAQATHMQPSSQWSHSHCRRSACNQVLCDNMCVVPAPRLCLFVCQVHSPELLLLLLLPACGLPCAPATPTAFRGAGGRQEQLAAANKSYRMSGLGQAESNLLLGDTLLGPPISRALSPLPELPQLPACLLHLGCENFCVQQTPTHQP